MQLHIAKNTTELNTQTADFIVEHINQTLQKQSRYTFALTGGNTPKDLYELLATDAYKPHIDWSRIHFFWGDERFVPFNDDRNNAKMAFDALLNKVPVKKENIHRIPTDNTTPQESAAAYEKLLHEYFPLVHTHHPDDHPENTPFTTFDLTMLGLGDNSHALSLFPHYPIIFEENKWVDSFYLDEQSMYRVTITHPVANHSALVLFMVAGKGKAEAVKHVLKDEYNPDEYPAQIIKPKGELHWFMDEAAAADLK